MYPAELRMKNAFYVKAGMLKEIWPNNRCIKGPFGKSYRRKIGIERNLSVIFFPPHCRNYKIICELQKIHIRIHKTCMLCSNICM